jgi:hypothetical protein
MVTTDYVNTQKFTFRAGAVSKNNTSAASERMYSLYFKEFKYNLPTQAILPVKLESFNAKLLSSKVVLDWTSSEEINFSHFIVERSYDGKEFNDVTMIFGDAHAIGYKYSYSEVVKASGMFYYRLKMVDRDGTFTYSAIRTVKLNQTDAQASIVTYPNPVASELKITIPSNWQDRQIVYDIVSMNGVVVKRHISEHASQTETLQVSQIPSGTYVIRLRAGNETAIQSIIKK